MELTSRFFAKYSRGKYLSKRDNRWKLRGKKNAAIFNSKKQADNAIIEFNTQLNENTGETIPVELFGFCVIEYRVPTF